MERDRRAEARERPGADWARSPLETTMKAFALAALSLAAAARAEVTFSFADPGTGRQFRNDESGAGPGLGQLSYDTAATLAVIVDGSAEGFGVTTFTNARMQLNMALGTATTIAGVTQAPVTGTFALIDNASNTVIVSGTTILGTFVRVSGTSALFSSDPLFFYTAGPALTAIMPPGAVLTAPAEAVFTLTNLTPDSPGPLWDPFTGVFKDFTGDASYSGSSEVVPAPGAFALLGLGTLVAARRWR